MRASQALEVGSIPIARSNIFCGLMEIPPSFRANVLIHHICRDSISIARSKYWVASSNFFFVKFKKKSLHYFKAYGKLYSVIDSTAR